MSAEAEKGDTWQRLTGRDTVIMLAVLVFLTVLEVLVAISNGPPGIVTVALLVLAIVQALYILLVAMGLGHETRITKRWVYFLLCIGIFYTVILSNESHWRSQFWRVLR